jgi:autotransporter-associated beta strand protein
VKIVTTNTTGTEGLTTNGKSTTASGNNFVNSNGTLITNQRQVLNKFGKFSVASPGTQVGNVNISNTITAGNQVNTLYTLSIIASGDINVSSAINLASSNSGAGNWSAMNVVLSSSRNINITSSITTNGTSSGYYSVGVAGSITLTATENITSSSAGTLNAVGGFDPYGGNYSRGGDIALSAASVSLNGSINNRGHANSSTLAHAGNITISTTNTSTTAGVNDGQVSGVITGGNFTKSGAGTFILKRANTYVGTTTVSGGTLRLGANNSIPTGSGLVLAGGEFQSAGFSNTFASIALSANSTLRMGSGVHTLTFTNLGSFTSGTMLTIEGWQGSYANPGATGTAGKIVFNATTSTTILGQLKFKNSGTGNLHTSIQLGTKEIVAGNQ